MPRRANPRGKLRCSARFTGQKPRARKKLEPNREVIFSQILNSTLAAAMNMDKRDINVTQDDYKEIIKWARLRNQRLAEVIDNKKEIIRDRLTAKPHYRIRKDDINEDDALDLLHMFFDNEQYSNTDEDCIYFGHLAEVWRPIAEGPLI